MTTRTTRGELKRSRTVQKQARRAVTEAFKGTEEQIAQREREVREQARAAKEQITGQEKQVSQRETALGRQRVLRQLDIQTAALRRQRVQQLGGFKAQLKEAKQAVTQREKEVLSQVEEAKLRVARAKKEALERVLKEPQRRVVLKTEEGKVVGTAKQFIGGEVGEVSLAPVQEIQIKEEAAQKLTAPISPTVVRTTQRQRTTEAIEKLKEDLEGLKGTAKEIKVATGALVGRELFLDPSLKPTVTTQEQVRVDIESARRQTGKQLISGGLFAGGPAGLVSGFIKSRLSARERLLARVSAEEQAEQVIERSGELSKQADILSKSQEEINLKTTNLNKEIEDFNRKFGQRQLSPQEISTASSRREKLNKELEKLIKKQQEQDVKFSKVSTEFEKLPKDLAPQAIKFIAETKETRPTAIARFETGLAVSGTLAGEAAKFAVLGEAVGATGALPTVGAAVTPQFITTVAPAKGAVLGIGAAGIGTIAGIKGTQAFALGAPKEVGIESAILGAATPIVQTTAFVGGAVAGSKAFAARQIKQIKIGRFGTEIGEKRGKLLPSGKTRTFQRSRILEEVKGTKIKVDTKATITAKETPRAALGKIKGKAVVKGLPGVKEIELKGKLARAGKTIIIKTGTKTPSGKLIKQTFRVRLRDLRITPTDDPNIFSLDFEAPTTQIGAATEGKRVFLTLKQVAKLIEAKGDLVNLSFASQQVKSTPSGTFFTRGLTRNIAPELFLEQLKKGIVVRGTGSFRFIPLAEKGGTLLPPTFEPLPSQLLVSKEVAALTPTAPLFGPSIAQTIGPAAISQAGAFGLLGGLSLATGVSAATLQRARQAQLARLSSATIQTPSTLLSITPKPVEPQPPLTPSAVTITTPQVQEPVVTPSVTPVAVQPTTPIGPPPITPTPTIEPPSGPSALISGIRKIRGAAYDVFVKKRGQFRKVADDLPLGRALKRGANITKATIASHFRVKRDFKATSTQKDVSFRPNPTIFRDFMIRKGTRIPLPKGPDTFEYIERKRKRLTTPGEIGEIQLFRRQKSSKLGGFSL